jgi:predicted alpha/beta hydrolase family esterase
LKNALIIHGTGGYPEENWFPWLKNKLEQKEYKVSVPHFPSPATEPVTTTEWFDVLKDYEINEETILIAHSLGGVFALRILEKLEYPIKATFFVGTPVGIKPIKYYDSDVKFSGFDFEWDKIRQNARRFVAFHSNDDPFVSLDNGKKLAEELGITLHFVPNAGHFNAAAGYTEFHDLLKEILHEL